MKNTISKLPLIAVSYLQQLANGNPRMVQSASTYFQKLHKQFDSHQLSENDYLKLIEKYIDAQQMV